jgi:ribonuclease VapC
MVVDSSAVIAILRAEPDAASYSTALARSDQKFMSAGTLLELGVVLLHREGPPLVADLFDLNRLAEIEIVPVSEAQARDAIQAYSRFGKASNHPARLNYGDCFSYTLAKSLDQPLLFKGDDFAQTDIRSAL